MENDLGWGVHLRKGGINSGSVANVAGDVGCGGMAPGWSISVDVEGVNFAIRFCLEDGGDHVVALESTASGHEDRAKRLARRGHWRW